MYILNLIPTFSNLSTNLLPLLKTSWGMIRLIFYYFCGYFFKVGLYSLVVCEFDHDGPILYFIDHVDNILDFISNMIFFYVYHVGYSYNFLNGIYFYSIISILEYGSSAYMLYIFLLILKFSSITS